MGRMPGRSNGDVGNLAIGCGSIREQPTKGCPGAYASGTNEIVAAVATTDGFVANRKQMMYLGRHDD